MKSVLNPETNEVLGFDDNMSDDQISQAIQSDKDGRPQADVNPTPYDAIVRPALEQAKITGNNDILYAANRRALDEDPFNKAILHGLTFGLTPDNNAQVKIANPTEDIIGNLAGQTASILGTAGLGEFLGAGKAAAGAGAAIESVLPAGIKQAIVGSGEVLAPTAGKVISSVAQGVTGSAILGAMYNGITESVAQGKAVFGNENGDVEQKAPDLVKIGKNIITAAGKGALTWAPYGVGGAFMADTASGIAAGTAATAGTAYAVSRADGQSEADSRFNALLLGMFHFVSHVTAGAHPTETPEKEPVSVTPSESDLKPADNIAKDETGKPIEINKLPELQPEDRKAMVEDLQNIVADYTKAKNGMTEGGNIHQMVGDELVKSEAQNVIDQSNQETAARPDIVKIPDEKPEIAQQFKDPYAPATLDYLAQYIPPKEVASMAPEARLALANAPWQELRDVAAKYESGELPDIFGAKVARDAKLARTQNNTLQEIASSDTLTKTLTGNVTKKMIDAQNPKELGSNPDLESAQKKLKKIDQFEISKDYLAKQGRTDKIAKVDELIEKNKLTPQEEDALVSDITGGEPESAAQPAAPVAIPEFKGTTEAMMFGRANKDNPDIVKQLQAKYDEGVAKQAELREQSAKAVEAGDIKLSDDLDSQGFELAGKNQLYREAVEGFKGAKTAKELMDEKANVSRETIPEKTPEHGNEDEKKTAKVSSDINAKLVEKGFNELAPEEQARFDTITKKDQLKKVSDILDNDYEQAKKMANGEEALPDGVNSQVLFNAVKNRAIEEGDGETLRDLASSPLAKERSLAAQTLGASGFNNGEIDPVKIIDDVNKSLNEKVSKDTVKTKKEVSDVVKKEIAKAKPKQSDWDSFIESIKC